MRTTTLIERRRIDERDSGAILVMTLVLCLVLGVIATALATYAMTGLKTSKVTDFRNNQVTALDAGLRIGMELIQSNPTACLSNYQVPQPISGATVTVKCVQINPLLSPQWMTYRITSNVGSNAQSGVAIVQATTSSAAQCLPLTAGLVQSPPCILTVNSWSVAS